MLVLCGGFVSIVSAIARETGLEAGPDAGAARAPARPYRGPHRRVRRRQRHDRLGNWWWGAEASSYARYVYKPLQATPSVTSDGRLRLDLRDPGWLASRRLDDFVVDHGHLMHLFVVSPTLDHLWHLHPDQTASGAFEVQAARHAAGSGTNCSLIPYTGPASQRRSPVSSIHRRFAASR